MKLLLDQDVYAMTARHLKDEGHDVGTAAELGLAQAIDETLLRVAQETDRILITRDRDFGTLVFVQGLRGGVLYLRLLPSTINAVHRELDRVLRKYSEEELKRAFVVVEPHGHRIRHVPSSGE